MGEFFSSYLGSVMTIGICAFICETVSSASQTSAGTKNAMRLICSLCVFITVIIPFCSGIRSFYTHIATSGITAEKNSVQYENSFLELTEKETEKRIMQEILDKTGIIIKSADIDLCEKENMLIVLSVRVTVSNKDSGDADNVRQLISDMFGSDAEIKIEVDSNE